MSLQKVADGILETHVTWEDVEEKLQESLKTKAKLGKNKSAVHIGEGNGFLSRIALITCDWEGAETSEKLPVKFALKLASCLAAKAMEDAMPADVRQDEATTQAIWDHFEVFLKQLHNSEIHAYSFLSRFADQLSIPKCYFTVPFSDENKLAASIALEYLANTSIKHIYQTLSVPQAIEVAKEIGKMQGLSILHGVEKEEWLADRDVFTTFWKNFTPEVFTQMFAPLKQMDPTMTECVDAISAIVPAYYGSNLAITLHTQYEGIRPVFVNGDMWSANVLLDNDTQRLRALVDFQLIHHGTGVEDILRIAMSGMSSTDRRAHMTELLDAMYDSLIETLQGAPAPYTRDQMYELYEIVLPHAGFFFAPVAMPLFMSSTASPDLSEEEKSRRRTVVLDKVRGLCEDIVIFDKKNADAGRNSKYTWTAPDFAPHQMPNKE